MRIVLAPNAFKESLSAAEAAEAMAAGLKAALPEARLVRKPVADGGDGTAAVLAEALGGTVRRREATGPTGERILVELTRLSDASVPTDVIEVANAAGLARTPTHLRDPLATTSAGLGEAIRFAREDGARRIVVALGGSATVDGGVGALRALGFRFLDDKGRDLPPGPASLENLAEVVRPDDWPLDATGPGAPPEILAACDVSNKLLGPKGAAPVFGPQKGARPEDIPALERGLARLALHVATKGGERTAGMVDMRGGGAAGGIAFGFAAFLNATLKPGADLVLDAIGFDAALEGADLVLTGEGRLDMQTLAEKAPAVVGRRAAAAGIPAFALAGSVDPALAESAESLGRAGLVACASIVPGPCDVATATAEAAPNLRRACFNLARGLIALLPEKTTG